MKTLLCWRGEWMTYTGNHWIETDQAELRGRIYNQLEHVHYEEDKKGTIEIVPFNPNKRKIADVLEAMRAVGHLSSKVDAPQWIGTAEGYSRAPAREIVSCTNGLLHVPTKKLLPHTPTFFSTVAVPFEYLPDAPAPTTWLNFLGSIWPDDPDSIALLQEYTGYILSGRTDMQKALLLIGPTRSGKGTYARMLGSLVGAGNAAGPTLASLGTNFGLSPLLGKPLAIVSDARLGSAGASTVVERLLSITGEDMLTVDRKFKDPWSGKLPSRFVILSNELPRFGDASGAVANRFLILQMTKSFLGKEDRTLDGPLDQPFRVAEKYALMSPIGISVKYVPSSKCSFHGVSACVILRSFHAAMPP
jgi:putative DNA primase/helicase